MYNLSPWLASKAAQGNASGARFLGDMSKKKTPQEKKEAAYEKNHYAFAWVSPQGFRKTWKKKKNYRNRVVRRKAKNLLHTVQCHSLGEFGPDEESLTSELFRKGLSQKKLYKDGVVSLREKVEAKKERREGNRLTRGEHKERLAVEYAASVVAFERNPHSVEAQKLVRNLNTGLASLWDFLREHPDWKMRLRAKIDALTRQEQLLREKAKLKQQQKRKWRSPTLSLPRNAT